MNPDLMDLFNEILATELATACTVPPLEPFDKCVQHRHPQKYAGHQLSDYWGTGSAQRVARTRATAIRSS